MMARYQSVHCIVGGDTELANNKRLDLIGRDPEIYLLWSRISISMRLKVGCFQDRKDKNIFAR